MSDAHEAQVEAEHELVQELRHVVGAPEDATVGALAKLIERLSSEIGFLNGLSAAGGDNGAAPAEQFDAAASSFWNMNNDDIAELGEMLQAIEIEETGTADAA